MESTQDISEGRCQHWSRCVILPGTTIGKNALIGAGSVVTKDILDNAIVASAPAKVLGNNGRKLQD